LLNTIQEQDEYETYTQWDNCSPIACNNKNTRKKNTPVLANPRPKNPEGTKEENAHRHMPTHLQLMQQTEGNGCSGGRSPQRASDLQERCTIRADNMQGASLHAPISIKQSRSDIAHSFLVSQRMHSSENQHFTAATNKRPTSTGPRYAIGSSQPHTWSGEHFTTNSTNGGPPLLLKEGSNSMMAETGHTVATTNLTVQTRDSVEIKEVNYRLNFHEEL